MRRNGSAVKHRGTVFPQEKGLALGRFKDPLKVTIQPKTFIIFIAVIYELITQLYGDIAMVN